MGLVISENFLVESMEMTLLYCILSIRVLIRMIMTNSSSHLKLVRWLYGIK